MTIRAWCISLVKIFLDVFNNSETDFLLFNINIFSWGLDLYTIIQQLFPSLVRLSVSLCYKNYTAVLAFCRTGFAQLSFYTLFIFSNPCVSGLLLGMHSWGSNEMKRVKNLLRMVKFSKIVPSNVMMSTVTQSMGSEQGWNEDTGKEVTDLFQCLSVMWEESKDGVVSGTHFWTLGRWWACKVFAVSWKLLHGMSAISEHPKYRLLEHFPVHVLGVKGHDPWGQHNL